MHPRFQAERMDAARAKIKAAVEKLAKERGVTVDLPDRHGRDAALNNLYLWEDLAAAVEKVAAEDNGPLEVNDPADKRPAVRCTGTTASGEPCKRWASEGSDRCSRHQE